MTEKLVAQPSGQQSSPEVSHNLFGQRLGRKGQETRERILTTALRLIESSSDTQLTLSAVAREASVGMTTLYLYFPDLGDLVLAVLVRVMDSAGAAFEDQLRTRWPDASLEACCFDYLLAHHEFWVRHARVLQIRNKFTDASDLRFVDYSNRISVPLVRLFIQQMDGDPEIPNTPIYGVGTILLIMLERMACTVTNATFFWAIRRTGVTDEPGFVRLLLKAEADVMANTIRHQREIAQGYCELPQARRARA